jgi:hypothetical protein
MKERRDPPPDGGSRPPIQGGATLPNAQQAHLDYSGHAERCQRCRDIDRGRCDQGETLWRAWNTALDDAYRRLNPGRP